jgi:hypothetical protein
MDRLQLLQAGHRFIQSNGGLVLAAELHQMGVLIRRQRLLQKLNLDRRGLVEPITNHQPPVGLRKR